MTVVSSDLLQTLPARAAVGQKKRQIRSQKTPLDYILHKKALPVTGCDHAVQVYFLLSLVFWGTNVDCISCLITNFVGQDDDKDGCMELFPNSWSAERPDPPSSDYPASSVAGDGTHDLHGLVHSALVVISPHRTLCAHALNVLALCKQKRRFIGKDTE